MREINAAVILRGRDMQSRRLPKTGWWTYPVEGFTWTLYGADDDSVYYREKLASLGHDVIIYEDWQWSAVVGTGIPLVCVIVDSNTSEERHQRYRRKTFSRCLLPDGCAKPDNRANACKSRWLRCSP